MLTRRQLTKLAERILAEPDEARQDELIAEFEANVPHPAPVDLFRYPRTHFEDHTPTAEEIVDAASGYVDPERALACTFRRRPRRRVQQRR